MTRPPEAALRLVVVTAGLSRPSATRLLGERLAAATSAALHRGGAAVEVEIVELRDWAADLTNHLLTGIASAGLAEVLARVSTADAVIAVSPIFRASYSGLFKTFFDVLDADALRGTPVLIAATGGSVRHSLALDFALRPLFSYLQATVVPTAVFAATEDWASAGGLTDRIDRATAELAALLTGQRRGETPPDVDDSVVGEDSEVIPFPRLLAAQHALAVQQR